MFSCVGTVHVQMIRFWLLLIAAAGIMPVQAAGPGDYWRFDQYYDMYPE